MSTLCRRTLLTVVLLVGLSGTLSAQATRIISSGTLPTNCTVGNIYLKTGASAGFYVCLATDTWTGPFITTASSGDFSSNTSTSVDGEVVLFSGTGGKTGKRATGSGIAKITSGVLSTASSGTDYVVPGGNVATATALAANGSNCSSGQFPLGVDASGASESCTALPTSISGTSNEIAASASTGAVTLSLPTTVNLSSHTLRVPNSTSLPGTCTLGDAYMDTDATSGQRWYLCESTNTWTVQGGSGGGGTNYQTVQDEGSDLTQRAKVNFTGSGINCVDNSGSSRTDCTVSGVSTKWHIVFTALNDMPPATNPATPDTRNNTAVLDFDTTTQERAIFMGVLPSDYGGAGVTVCAHWAAATATSGTIGWQLAFERIGNGSQDIDSDGFGSTQTITAATVSGTSGNVSITCVNVSNGSNMDSLAAGELFRLAFDRDVANDSATGDAQLLAVDIKEQ